MSSRLPTGACNELQHRLTVEDSSHIERRMVPPLVSSLVGPCSPALDVRRDQPFVGEVITDVMVRRMPAVMVRDHSGLSGSGVS